MQMGRWFGFRAGYRDLVRLYIGRSGSGHKTSTYDLYKAFEAACRSEELFRDEIETIRRSGRRQAADHAGDRFRRSSPSTCRG